ncbi:MAG: substrate binding domain-containing protein, partial [Rhodobacteraceae bacterium]|nr:substrate binding domain-containing protein [Paracoccaceae bacterium]
IRLGTLADSSLIARRISPIRAVLVASPAYLARRGTPRGPAALAEHEVIPHGEAVWQFRRDGRTTTFHPRGRFTADSGAAELAGVVAGLGIAAMPSFLAGPAVRRGEIVTLLDDYEIPALGLYVLRPPPVEPVPHKIRVLTDIMLEHFGGDDWDKCPRRA